MTNPNSEKHALQRMFECMGLELRSYSGRGMSGRYCLGVEADSSMSLLMSVLENMHELTSEDNAFVSEDEDEDGTADQRGVVLKTIAMVSEAFKKARDDSMGRGHIVYFPSIQYVEQTDNKQPKHPAPDALP